MNNELTHYGVKGMKWGVRRQIKKEVNRHKYGWHTNGDHNPTGQHTRAVADAYAQAVKKENRHGRKAMIELYKRADKLVKRYNSTFDPQAEREIEDLNKEYSDALFRNSERNMAIANRFVDDYNRAMLKDLGVENVDAGMKYLKRKNLEVNMVDMMNMYSPDIDPDEER